MIARSRDEEDGFTLIELMVVVLIIAILIAIAIPTFLGARQRAQDRASQSDLRNALTAEKTVYTDTQAYDATTATMQGVEASLNWNGADTTKTAMNVYVGNSSVGTADMVCVDEKSKSGKTFCHRRHCGGPEGRHVLRQDGCVPGDGHRDRLVGYRLRLVAETHGKKNVGSGPGELFTGPARPQGVAAASAAVEQGEEQRHMQREHLGARGTERKESGFTLIELMMVIFIIGILIAVLMPVFYGATARAKDRATQSSLHDALTAAKSVFADKADYTQATTGALTQATGAITFVGSASSPNGQNTVSVDPVATSYLVLAAHSKAGSCFYLADDAAGTGTLYARLGGAGGCAAGGAPLPGDPGVADDLVARKREVATTTSVSDPHRGRVASRRLFPSTAV